MKRIYLIYGEEDLLVEERLKSLKAEAAASGGGMLDVEFLDGKAATNEAIFNAAMSMSLLGGNKFVVINNYKALVGKRGKPVEDEDIDQEKGSEDVAPLISFLKTVSDAVVVVFVVNGNVDKRKKLAKVLDANASVEEFKPFADYQQDRLVAWITSRAGAIGKRIDPGAAVKLAEISGPGLRALCSELDKVSTYIGNKPSISEDDITAVASRGAMIIFALSDSLKRRDTKASLECLERLFNEKEAPPAILGFIASQVRTLLYMRALTDEGLSVNQIVTMLRKTFFQVQNNVNAARNYSTDELVSSLKLLHMMDLKLKSSAMQPRAALDIAVIDLCGKGGRQR